MENDYSENTQEVKDKGERLPPGKLSHVKGQDCSFENDTRRSKSANLYKPKAPHFLRNNPRLQGIWKGRVT